MLQFFFHMSLLPVSLVSITKLYFNYTDDKDVDMPSDGTWSRTHHNYSVLTWNNNKLKRTTFHPSNGLSEMQLNNKNLKVLFNIDRDIKIRAKKCISGRVV